MSGHGGRIERPVILCGDEFCLNVARYRRADIRDNSKPLYLCEKCYEALPEETRKYAYKERLFPIKLNRRVAG